MICLLIAPLWLCFNHEMGVIECFRVKLDLTATMSFHELHRSRSDSSNSYLTIVRFFDLWHSISFFPENIFILIF